MTPIEKAKDLYLKFNDASLAYDSGDHTAVGINNSVMAMVNQAKRCAIIAADEVTKHFEYDSNKDETQGYWQQVKKEIINL